jgi:hypothetical protein
MKIGAMLLTLLATTAVCLTCYATDPPLPTPQQIATADYGAPLTIDWQAAIKGWFLKRVKDPLATQYIFTKSPRPGYIQTVLRGTMFGYFTVVKVNAKDGSGAYRGLLPYLFMFKNNRIKRVGEPGEFNYHGEAMGADFYLD